MSLQDWLATSDHVIDPALRAVLAWRRITASPYSVVVRRNGTPLAAQTVRIEYSPTAHVEDAEVSDPGTTMVTIFGVEDHPTVTDTNLQRGDRFTYLNTVYQVIVVNHMPGEIQARAEAKSG